MKDLWTEEKGSNQQYNSFRGLKFELENEEKGKSTPDFIVIIGIHIFCVRNNLHNEKRGKASGSDFAVSEDAYRQVAARAYHTVRDATTASTTRTERPFEGVSH